VDWLQPVRSASSASPVTASPSTATRNAGVQPHAFGGVPAYVMPNTSGLNARVSPDDLAEHCSRAGSPTLQRR
jgi:hypothetical protein